MKHFQKIYDKLLEINERKNLPEKYFIPSLWTNSTKNTEIIPVNPNKFFISAFDNIKSKVPAEFNNYLEKSIIYNMMVRLTTAFDHNQNGKLDLTNKNDYRETGTFLKSIAILPYIKSLGVNIIYLLPITSIGSADKKGNLGSIYAVKNPYKLDENLSEPILEMPVEEQFQAFVEAAHHLGIKVITEFIFRTASIDCDWAINHPDWFYWIKDTIKDKADAADDEFSYAPPKFEDEILRQIKQDVEKQVYTNLFPPSDEYQNIFTETPEKVFFDSGKVKGKLNDGTIVRIPGAFADWPPDDNQPLWTDVTYLKLYHHPDYNYIAYNTVRMYDDIISDDEYINSDLWDYLSDIIPYYIREFDIDGIMLDMGHALPLKLRRQILDNAKECKERFILFEENFILSEESKQEGYDAAVGYLPFDFFDCNKMKGFLYRTINNDIPILSFATAENHNTKRTYKYFENKEYCQMVWAVSRFLPNAIPFIHSGFELLESTPVNTGLGFTDDEINSYSSNELALFSSTCLNWTSDNIIEYMKSINFISQYFLSKEIVVKVEVLNNCKYNVLVYILTTEHNKEILCLANYSDEINHSGIIFEKNEENCYKNFYNSITNVNFEVRNNTLNIELNPYEFMVGIIK